MEAQCVEIRSLLSAPSEASRDQDTINTYITRENLILCSRFYGQHFQPNVPLLHMASFDICRASPALLCAIMLAGSCYCGNVIPTASVTKLATLLLLAIENQEVRTTRSSDIDVITNDSIQHEKRMTAPPISTIQASVLVRPVLILSGDSAAYRYAFLNFARIISMAERAGIFNPIPPVDYNAFDESSFDWSDWIAIEMRRRYADLSFSPIRRRTSKINSSQTGLPDLLARHGRLHFWT